MRNTKIFKNLIWIVKTINFYNRRYIFISSINTIINGVLPVLSLLTMQKIINILQIPQGELNYVLYYVLIYVFLELFNTIYSNLYGFYNAKINLNFSLYFSKILLNKISKLKLKDFENSETYDIINRANSQGGDKLISYYNNFIKIISNVITTVSYLSIIFIFKYWIAIVIIIIPIIKFIFSNYFNIKSFNILRERTNDARRVWYIEYLITYGTFFKELKTYNLFNYFINKYDSLKSGFNKQDIALTRKSTFCFSLLSIIESLIDGSLFAYIIYLGFKKIILIGDSITYTRTIIQSKANITNILLSISGLFKESLFIDQIFELLNVEEEQNNRKIIIKDIESIELVNLYFKYENSTNYVLKNINLKLEKNKKISIMGRNGSGKTTLIKLIMGLYDDYDGSILINGIDLKEIDKNNYLYHISTLFQDYIKYEATFRENIAYSNLNILYNDKQLYNISKKFGLDHLIYNREKNLDTQLGNWFDSGINLSAGQWQRIAIARAFAKESDLYILDEPDAALDIISEEEILDLYCTLFKDKIGIVISHKFNKLNNIMDEIIMIDNGVIIERGNHKELLKRNGLYKKFLSIKEKCTIN